jgi:VCBS repeat-containing protein
MASSDVQAVFITADSQALDADGISTAATLSGSGNLTINGALASGGSCTFNAGRVVTILSAGDDSGDTFTVTGTDVNGDAQTEAITGANAGTATGAKYFKTVTQIAASGASAGNVSAGINASAGDAIFAGRMRLKGVFTVHSGTAGTVSFTTSSPAGSSVLKLGTVASATSSRDVTIPADGIVCSSGGYVQYTAGTFSNMTVFHA